MKREITKTLLIAIFGTATVVWFSVVAPVVLKENTSENQNTPAITPEKLETTIRNVTFVSQG